MNLNLKYSVNSLIETDAIKELQELRSFRDAVAKDRDVQNLIAQRQEAVKAKENQRLQVQQSEQDFLDKYEAAALKGNPKEIVLTLAREIRAQAKADAEAEINSRFQHLAEPIRLKQQLLDSTQWADLHAIADETTWLAGELGRLGYDKPQIANLVRRIGQKYSNKGGGGGSIPGGNEPSNRRSGQRLESPDSGGYSQKADKDWDSQIDNYWKEQGY